MKNFNKLSAAIFVTTILLMCSCTKDDDVLTDATENVKAGEQLVLDPKKTYTDEELDKLGYKSLGMRQTDGVMAVENNVFQKAASLSQESTVDLDDLRAINPNYADTNYMRDRLTWGARHFYGHDLLDRGQGRVKGVWVNNVQFGSGNNVSQARGWAVTKKFTYNHVASNDVWTDWKEETSQNFDARRGALRVEQYTPYNKEVTYSTSFETTTGSNVSASIGFEIPTWGLNGSLELGYSQSTTRGTFNSETKRYTVVVPAFTLPKGKRVTKSVFSRIKIIDRTYRTPVRMYGRVAMDYGCFCYGDPYWSLDANGEVFYELNNDQKKINLRVKEQGAIQFEVRELYY
jgi:hypothetical protein